MAGQMNGLCCLAGNGTKRLKEEKVGPSYVVLRFAFWRASQPQPRFFLFLGGLGMIRGFNVGISMLTAKVDYFTYTTYYLLAETTLAGIKTRAGVRAKR